MFACYLATAIANDTHNGLHQTPYDAELLS